MINTLRIIETSWEKDRRNIQFVRQSVFIEEQSVPEAEEWDSLDQSCIHFLVLHNDNPIATARLTPSEESTETGIVGRMAVLANYRNLGIASTLLNTVMGCGRRYYSKLFLHAQCHSINLYTLQGFSSIGKEFLEVGIPHLAMEKDLKEEKYQVIETPKEFLDHSCQLVRACKKELRILSSTLDHDIFDTSLFADSLSQLARYSRHSDIRILVKSIDFMLEHSHRVVELQRRIPSHIQIRLIPWEPQDKAMAFIIGDNQRLLFKNDDNNYRSFIDYNTSEQCKNLISEFDHLWQHAKASPELRRLGL